MRAGPTCSGTCCSSGSSATTSRTRSDTPGFSSSISSEGFAATTLQSAVTLWSGTDADAAIPNLGASGAVSAVLGAYLLLLPGAKVLTLVFFILREIPAIVFLGVWFLFQLSAGSASLQSPQQGGGVAFFAHVGGFVFGILLVKLVQIRPPLRPRY